MNKLFPLFLIVLVLNTACSSQSEKNIIINEILCANVHTNLHPKNNNADDWIELKNTTNKPIEVGGYYLSNNTNKLKKWQIQVGTVISPKGFLLIWTNGENTEYNTNFKLKSKSGVIYLSDAEGNLIDSLSYTEQRTDVSYGLYNGVYNYFDSPTPGKENKKGITELNYCNNPKVDKSPGFYNDKIIAGFEKKDNDIYYTTDGSVPTKNSNKYDTPISIEKTTIIRAKAFNSNKLSSNIVTFSYFINENHSLPVLSMVTDSLNLWDDYIGIYTQGKNGAKGAVGPVANWNQDWERPISIEYFENSTLAFQEDCGAKIIGFYISGLPQKPFGFYMRSKYSADAINYPIFKEKNIDSYSNLVLRPGTFWKTLFRDGLMQSIVANEYDVNYQAYQPIVLYINGKYWGIENLREKQNLEYIIANNTLNTHDIDLLEKKLRHTIIIEGDDIAYDELLNLASVNLSVAENYNKIAAAMDISQFIDYTISEIYFANTDWPHNNVKFWKERSDSSKWKWIMFDVENGFDFYNNKSYESNFISYTIQSNSEFSSIFRSLLKNPAFAQEFIQTFACRLSTTYNANRVNNLIDSLQRLIEPEIEQHIERWGGTTVDWYKTLGKSFESKEEWENNIAVLKQFANLRPTYNMKELKTVFNLSETVKFNISNNNGGEVKVYNVSVKNNNLNAEVFKNVPLKLQAIPKEGYEFVGWEGLNATAPIIGFVPTQNVSVKAIFKEK